MTISFVDLYRFFSSVAYLAVITSFLSSIHYLASLVCCPLQRKDRTPDWSLTWQRNAYPRFALLVSGVEESTGSSQLRQLMHLFIYRGPPVSLQTQLQKAI